jgi:hypothetical protein
MDDLRGLHRVASAGGGSANQSQTAASGGTGTQDKCGTRATVARSTVTAAVEFNWRVLMWSPGSGRSLDLPPTPLDPRTSPPTRSGTQISLGARGRHDFEIGIPAGSADARQLLIDAARTFRRRMVQVVRIPSRHQRICRVPPAHRPAASPSSRSKMRSSRPTTGA